jgi:hypothetical protein
MIGLLAPGSLATMFRFSGPVAQGMAVFFAGCAVAAALSGLLRIARALGLPAVVRAGRPVPRHRNRAGRG